MGRKSTENEKNKKESAFLRFLYGMAAGRIILRPLRAKRLSAAVGAFLDTRLSKIFIKPFVKSGNIDLSEYESDNFACFNDCFTRKIKDGMRPFDNDPDVLAAPCDGRLSVCKINGGTVMPVKQSLYTVESLLCSRELAAQYENGYAFVFRLCVDNYHRYAYPVSGVKSKNTYINGTLHTVRPIAQRNIRVFCENSREYTVIDTGAFGSIVQMEVGAMLVGKIKNYNAAPTAVKKGEEKGMFLYGGSTVILLTKSDTLTPLPEFIKNTENGIETPIKMGERIAVRQ